MIKNAAVVNRKLNTTAIVSVIVFLASVGYLIYVKMNYMNFIQQFNLVQNGIYVICVRPLLYISGTYLVVWCLHEIVLSKVNLSVPSKKIRVTLIVVPLCLVILYFVLSGLIFAGSNSVQWVNRKVVYFLWQHSYLFFVFGVTTYYGLKP